MRRTIGADRENGDVQAREKYKHAHPLADILEPHGVSTWVSLKVDTHVTVRIPSIHAEGFKALECGKALQVLCPGPGVHARVKLTDGHGMSEVLIEADVKGAYATR
jgi:hypothetical protein